MRMFTRFFTGVLPGAVVLLFLAVAPVRAMVFTVSTADDLTAAVVQANANGEADTIVLVDNPTITVVAPLDISSDMTINGPGTLTGTAVTTLLAIFGGTMTLDNITVQNCATACSAMLINNASCSVTNCTFLNNTATAEDAYYASAITASNANITLTDSAFTGNTTDAGAGAILVSDGSLVVSGCTFTTNASPSAGTTNGYAGAITAMSCPMTVTDSTFSGNTSMSVGGAIDNYDAYTMLDGCTFDGNSAGLYGGAVGSFGAQLDVTGCTFTNNSTPFAAGAIFFSGAGNDQEETDYPMLLMDCVFRGNHAESTSETAESIGANFVAGGAIVASELVVALNCQFTNNWVCLIYAADDTTITPTGGAVLSLGEFAAVNCAFSANSATCANGSSFGDAEATGGAIGPLFSYKLDVFNCTFSGNTVTASAADPTAAQSVGGGIALADGMAILANSILWGNLANGEPDQMGMTGDTLYDPNVSYCDIEGGWIGTGNIDADPAFVRAPGAGEDGALGTADDDPGDLALTMGSPCIDMGSNDFTFPDFSTTDLAGNPRIVNDIVDMGAYEYQQTDQPPVLTLPATAFTCIAGNPLTFTATATDPDTGDTLTFSLANAPDGAAIDPSSGDFTWTPTAVGTFTFDVTVTDAGGLTDTKSVTVTVESALTLSVNSVVRKGKLITVTVTITNARATTAYNTVVTAATLHGTATNSPLPLLYGAIKPGTSKKCTLQFKDAAPGAWPLTVQGSCTLGLTYLNQIVTVP